MKCTDARPLLDLLCDGALEAKDSALVLDHLKTCDECQHEWQELEELHAKFQEEKGSTQVPAGLMDKISEKLKEAEIQEQRRVFGASVRAMSVVAVAAVLLVIGVLVIPYMNKPAIVAPPTQVASNVLIDAVVSDATVEPVDDRSQLAKKAGYDLKYVRLPEWQMQRSGLYKSRTPVPIARFDFVRNDKTGLQHLTCYQAPQGAIGTDETKLENVGGKRVFFGHHGSFQFALWSQNGRDYLFVTTLPSGQLEDIVRGA